MFTVSLQTAWFITVTNSGIEEDLLNPFLMNLTLTKWTCLPSYLVLIFSSVLVLYIVWKKYRAVLNVYFSVLFYIFCQIQFLIVTTVSWVTESSRKLWCSKPVLEYLFFLLDHFSSFISLLPPVYVLCVYSWSNRFSPTRRWSELRRTQ